MRTKGSYIGHYPQVIGTGIKNADGIYPLNQTFSLRADNDWPTQPQIISLTLSTTSLNETDNRDLTVTVVIERLSANFVCIYCSAKFFRISYGGFFRSTREIV